LIEKPALTFAKRATVDTKSKPARKNKIMRNSKERREGGGMRGVTKATREAKLHQNTKKTTVNKNEKQHETG